VNGAIERYMLYMSTAADQSPGTVVYSSTQLLQFHTLNNLTAGTLYFIRLAVSLLKSNDSQIIILGSLGTAVTMTFTPFFPVRYEMSPTGFDGRSF